MEEPTKYEVKRDTNSKAVSEMLKQKFESVGRSSAKFVSGDIVITEDNRLQRVGSDLSQEKALELLESHALKAFYPVESQIELQ